MERALQQCRHEEQKWEPAGQDSDSLMILALPSWLAAEVSQPGHCQMTGVLRCLGRHHQKPEDIDTSLPGTVETHTFSLEETLTDHSPGSKVIPAEDLLTKTQPHKKVNNEKKKNPDAMCLQSLKPKFLSPLLWVDQERHP